MSLKNLTNNYATYNSWANSKFVNWLQNIEEDLLYKQIPSSYNSIDNTVQHILRIQKFWTDFISIQDVSKFDWSVKENHAQNNLIELKNQSIDMENSFLRYTDKELTELIELNMPWAKNKLNRYEYVIHAINHSTFHRGQIITIARGIGITENIPSTDYNFFHCE
ncbi:DinB family protein [Aurantibacillus circumpalustris]|uniref:DinB family protein n=1 Tax=Aurantibacillus circumpalustris TaxID=3036359 RepID=UPI00295BBA48|nr:DinB family protein [Aurantibacillus circumpalustris]